MPFSATVVPDASTGWDVVVLRYDDAQDASRTLEARVAPAAGANLFSFRVGDQELLEQPGSLADLTEQPSGTPILFPTPNRVRNAKMQFEGHTFSFPANSQANFIHGLVRKRPWQAGAIHSDSGAASAELHLVWDDKQPDFAQFPIKHRLSVTFTLRKSGLRIAYRVDNLDSGRLAFGFGLHPYFRVPGDRADVLVKVPLERRMEAVDMLPTGELAAVEGTPYDLRKPRALSDLRLDDVYFGMAPGKPAWFELREQGLRLELSGSRDFTHVVVYTPPERTFFCIENQTSSTDAHNLWTAGKKKVSNLLVVPPKKSAQGFVDWVIRRVPPARPRHERITSGPRIPV